MADVSGAGGDRGEVDGGGETVLQERTECWSEVFETAVERTCLRLQSPSCSSACSVWQEEEVDLLPPDRSRRLLRHVAWCFDCVGH